MNVTRLRFAPDPSSKPRDMPRELFTQAYRSYRKRHRVPTNLQPGSLKVAQMLGDYGIRQHGHNVTLVKGGNRAGRSVYGPIGKLP